jgi:hypothetical protein
VEPLALRGRWFTPDKRDSPVYGTLSFSKEEGAILKLDGTFRDVEYLLTTDTVEQVIFGLSADGEAITLFDCFCTNFSLSSLPSTSTYFAHLLLIGKHVRNPETQQLKKLQVAYSGMEHWVNKKLFMVERGQERTSVTLNPPVNIPLVTNDHQDICISTAGLLAAKWTSLKFNQSTRFVIKDTQNSTFKALRTISHRINDFLTLVCGQPVEVQHMGVVCADGQVVKVYFQPIRAARKPFSPGKVLLRLTDSSSNQIGSMLSEWLSKYEHLRSSFDLYFATIYNPGAYSKERFLSLARAIEAYHRCTYSNCDIDPDEHDKRVEEVISAVPKTHQEWLRKQLLFSNEPSLRKRLQDLMRDPANVIFPDHKLQKKLVQATVETRHSLTHPDPTQDAKTKHNILVPLTEWLNILMEFLMFKETGLDVQELQIFRSKYSARLDWLMKLLKNMD